MEQKAPTHTSFQQEIKIFTLGEIPLGTITSHLHLPFSISTLQEDASVPQDTQQPNPQYLLLSELGLELKAEETKLSWGMINVL